MAIVSLVLVGVGYFWLSSWSVLLYTVSILLLGFTLYFFRDPARAPDENVDMEHLVLAPADGRVVMIEEVMDAPFINDSAIQISIFLSIFDVHVNRIPANGVLEHVEYHPGAYHIAWHPKASEENEHAAFGLQHPSGTRLYFKQIAGLIARRIMYHVEEGDTVRAGERFGVIRFGSRVDVLVPSSVSVEVQEGDRVRAGSSVLGRIPSGSSVKTPVLGGEYTEVVGS